MLNAYDTSDQAQIGRCVYNGIIVTPDQLKQNAKSQSPGANRLYVKPIRGQKVRRNGSNHEVDYQLSKEGNIENESHESVPNPTSSYQSPSMPRINSGTFNRDSRTRRSLGASSLAWSMPAGSFNEHVPTSRHLDEGSSDGTDVGQKELVINVVNLPSLNKLGFTLDSYSDNESGRFLGLRLRNRYFKQTVHLEARKKCPFLPGDLVVSVNQHRLSRMHESKAIRYAYNAFNEANKYNTEFGVLRESSTVDLDTEPVTSPFSYEAKTLPTRLHNRDSGIGQLSLDNFFDSSHQSCPSPPEKHRPRRNTQPAAIAVPSSLDATDAVPSLGILKAPKSPLLSPLLNNTTFFRNDPTSTTLSDDRIVQMHNLDSPAITQKSWRHKDSTGHSPPLQKRSTGVAQYPKDPNVFNTRAIGHIVPISLVKLPEGGFGFTMTSRDTQVLTGENNREPVYIKKILSTGAAIEDGRLLVGDRLLSVDHVEVRNLHQVLEQMRSVEPGETAALVVSRQVTAAAEEDSTSTGKGKSLPHRLYTAFTYEFTVPPGIDRSDPPSLGVTLKWSNYPPPSNLVDSASGSPRSSLYAPDPGLYVDSLVPNGLICTGNRNETLRPGDRLAGINGQSFDGLSSKAIASHIKTTLSDLYHEPQGDVNSFSLTVHRYDCPRRQSVFDSKKDPPSSRRPVLPSFELSLVDSRGRRTRTQSYTPILRGHSSLDLSDNRSLDDAPFDSCLRDCTSYFDREGFGRRSVSEKRHGQIDANEISFYQKNILPHRFGALEDKEKHYSTMPTTRRLKLHRERLALTTASHSASGGPMKALYQPEPTNTKSDSDASAGRSSNKRDPESGHFLRGRNQNASFRNAVYRSLASDESVSDNPVQSGIGTPLNYQKQTDNSTVRSEAHPTRVDMHPRIPKRQMPSSHGVRIQQGASSGKPNDCNAISAPVLPTKRHPKIPRSSKEKNEPSTASASQQLNDPSQNPITTRRSSKGGLETLKGLLRRVSEKISQETRLDNQHTYGLHLPPQSIPDSRTAVSPVPKDLLPSGYISTSLGQPIPTKGQHTNATKHQSTSVCEYNKYNRQPPPESTVLQMSGVLPPHNPSFKKLSVGTSRGMTEYPPFSALPSHPTQVPPPLPPRVRHFSAASKPKQTSSTTKMNPHHSPRLHLKPSDTMTLHETLSPSAPPNHTKHISHGNHSSRLQQTAGKAQRNHPPSSANHGQHIPISQNLSSPSRPQRTRIYENKAQSFPNSSARSSSRQTVRRETVAQNGYLMNSSVPKPPNHAVQSPHPSRSHQSRATERLPVPTKKQSSLPSCNPQPRRHHEHQRKCSRNPSEVAS